MAKRKVKECIPVATEDSSPVAANSLTVIAEKTTSEDAEVVVDTSKTESHINTNPAKTGSLRPLRRI